MSRAQSTAQTRQSTKREQTREVPTRATTRLNQRDLDSSCYRLSRGPNKFGAAKESSNSYASAYYQNSRETPDTRTPQEKLEEIDSQLGENSDSEDNKFELLVKKKLLTGLVYGECSTESINAATDLGAYYNSTNRPESALRHLEKAHQLAKSTDIEEEDGLKLEVEYADACMKITPQTSKRVNAAEQALTPYAETESKKKDVVYRRDIILAIAKSKRRQYAEALPFYERATENFIYKDDKELYGDIYVETAMCAEKAEEEEKAQEYYKKAYNIYKDAEINEKAESIAEKIKPEPEEEDEKEEEEEEKKEIEQEPPAETLIQQVTDQLVGSEEEESLNEKNE